MRLEQVTITTIVAEEGKVLQRKSDGFIPGERYTLGYNYYEAGLSLTEKKMEKPEDFDEIEKPEGYEEKPIINHVKRLKRANELIAQNIKEMNTLDLTSKEALEVVNWFPEWGIDKGFQVGDQIKRKMKFKYNGKLYAVLQDHIILEHYYPCINTSSLYVQVTEDYNDQGEETGTLLNPIDYSGNMILEAGKYYIQDGQKFLCHRNTENPVYHPLTSLVGLYVEFA